MIWQILPIVFFWECSFSTLTVLVGGRKTLCRFPFLTQVIIWKDSYFCKVGGSWNGYCVSYMSIVCRAQKYYFLTERWRAWVVMTIFLIFQVSALNPEVVTLEMYDEDLQYQVVSPTHWPLFYLGIVKNEQWDKLALSEGDHMKLWFTWQLTHDTRAWRSLFTLTSQGNVILKVMTRQMQCSVISGPLSRVTLFIT